MNFLQLVQKAARESGTLSVTPTAVTGQADDVQVLIAYVQDAWRNIQLEHIGWTFLRKSFSGTISAGVGDYTGAQLGLSDHAEWQTGLPQGSVDWPVSLYDPSVGLADEGGVEYWPDWDRFRVTYRRGDTASTQNRPVAVAIDPQNRLAFGPIPDKTYTVRGEYVRAPQELSADGDVPICDAQYHDVIVKRALLEFAGWDEAWPRYNQMATQYNILLGNMQRNLLPRVTLTGGALA